MWLWTGSKSLSAVDAAPPAAGDVRRALTLPVQSDLPAHLSTLRVSDPPKPAKGTATLVRRVLFGKSERPRAPQKGPRGGHGGGYPASVPSVFLKGMPLLKVSHKSKKRIYFEVDPERLVLSWRVAEPAAHRLWPAAAPPAAAAPPRKKYHRHLHIDHVRGVLYQEEASNYREELHISREFEGTWLTLFYYNAAKGKLKTLHVIADSERDLHRLRAVVADLRRTRAELARELHLGGVAAAPLAARASRQKERLLYEDVLRYSMRLGINVSARHLRRVFDEVAGGALPPGACATLDFAQFKQFVLVLKHRPDIVALHAALARDAGASEGAADAAGAALGFSAFAHFVRHVQHESVSDAQIAASFAAFASDGAMSAHDLDRYLGSRCNAARRCEAPELYYDKPLNEYFISSSHNTYLLGRQFAGASSIEGYIKALQRGCRCVEVDVWDEEDREDPLDGGPVVSHGRTFTTAISFLNVVKTIKRYAFSASPYPLIVSLEVHCSRENQMRMVSILRDTLGDALVLRPLEGDWFGLPSPRQLKHRIVVKVKRTLASSRLLVSDSGKYYTSTTTTTTSFSEDNAPAATGGAAAAAAASSGRKRAFALGRSKVCEELSNLGVYLQGIKFRNFLLPELKTFNHCFLIGEKALNSMLKDDERRAHVDKHNRRYLMRCYPSKIRLTSSNFSPLAFWASGVQMVATNWQTYDLGQQLNEAMFEGTAKSGYVIKPIALRKPLLKLMRPKGKPAVEEHRLRFRIDVISGHQLPKPRDAPINPFVTVEIFGATNLRWGAGDDGGAATADAAAAAVASDDRGHSCRTVAVAENGFNPVWNAVFRGELTAANDLVFVRFTVALESAAPAAAAADDATVGLVVARLSDLKRGYRYLPINDASGEELIYSQLFVRIDYEEVAQRRPPSSQTAVPTLVPGEAAHPQFT